MYQTPVLLLKYPVYYNIMLYFDDPEGFWVLVQYANLPYFIEKYYNTFHDDIVLYNINIYILYY